MQKLFMHTTNLLKIMPSEYIYTVKQLIAGVDDSVDLVHPNNEGLDWRVYSSVQMLRASLVFFFFPV